MEQSDQDIIAQVLAGKKQLYALIVQRYEKQVFNLMYRFCRSDQEAADMTQDVFLRAFEKLATHKQQHAFFSWLYALALNMARDWSRKKQTHSNKHKAFALENSDQEEFCSEISGLEEHEKLLQLEKALLQLPELTREIILLRYRQELPLREIAVMVNLSESAVKMRISRGLNQLKMGMKQQ